MRVEWTCTEKSKKGLKYKFIQSTFSHRQLGSGLLIRRCIGKEIKRVSCDIWRKVRGHIKSILHTAGGAILNDYVEDIK